MIPRRAVRGITIAFVYLAVISVVLSLFLMWPGTHDRKANLFNMVDGTAPRPFVYRVLLPGIVRCAVIGSEVVLDAAGIEKGRTPVSWIGAFMLRRTKAPEWTFEHSYTYGMYAIVAFLCLLGCALLLRRLIRSFYPRYPSFVSDFAPAIGMVIIPLVFFRRVSIPYDPMTLLMFTLCLYLIAERRHVAYFLVLPLAMLSKETAILLPFVFVAREIRVTPLAKLLLPTVCQIVICLAVRLLVMHLFRANPGDFVVNQLHANLMIVRSPVFYVKTLVPLLPLVVLVAYAWKTKPEFLRTGFVITATLLVGLSLVFGALGEMRVYYELYPFVFLLAVPAVVDVFGLTDRGE